MTVNAMRTGSSSIVWSIECSERSMTALTLSTCRGAAEGRRAHQAAQARAARVEGAPHDTPATARSDPSSPSRWVGRVHAPGR